MVSLSSVMPKVSGASILNGIFITIIVLLALIVIGFIIYYWTIKRKYGQYKVEIFDKDANGNVYRTYDTAGVFLDKKTDNRLLWVRKAKWGGDPNNIPYVSHKDKKGRLVKTVYLRRTGVNSYVYIHMKLGDTLIPSLGEEDLNNAAQEMVKIRRTFNKESWIAKYAPYIAFIITILIVMIVLISLFNKFGVIKEASANMLEVSEKQYEIIQALQNLTINTNQGTPIIVTNGGGGG